MGVGLQPLEFTECLADSPHFRENLQRHEKELERTSQQIKRLVKEVKDVVQAAKRLGAAQLALAASMEQFEFACIGASMTDDERVIGRSLNHFAQLIRTIEDERDRMLGRAHEQIIQPLERFRKEHIGAVKEGKKKFDKKTAKFCQSQERTLSLSTKKPETVFQEADAAMDMAERDFCQASLEYVFQLQAVQERKKFELVETLLGFVFGWWTFHHTAHDVHADSEPLVRDLQLRIQRTRSNFEETSKQTESLMKKMMEMRQMSKEEESGEEGGGAGAGGGAGGVARAGYLFLMEKKAFGTAWSKHYCTYEQSSQLLSLMPYNQINVKTVGASDSVCVSGARDAGEAERRFCWEALAGERPPLLLQSLGDRDRAAWLRALRPRARALAARRRRRRLRAPPHRHHRGARPRRAGPLQGGGRGVEGVAAGGAGAGGAAGRRGAGGPAGVGHAHADVRAEGLPARAARAAAHAPPARAVPRRRQVRAAGGARVRPARARARAAARQPRAAARRARPPAQRGRAQRPQPDDGVQPGGVLRADADARRARDRRLHPGAEVLQRAGGGAAGAPGGGVRRRAAAAAAARRRAARARAPARAQRPRGSRHRARARLRHEPQRHRFVCRVRAAAPAAAAAVRRARPLQLQLRVRLQPQRLPPAPRAARAAPAAGAHAVRVPRRERGRAVVRAEPDHHGRDAVAGAGLAARHAARPQRPRARELRGAAAVAPAAGRPAPAAGPRLTARPPGPA